MSDKKTDIETDFEERLAQIANKKLRTRTNNDIYDRFISRVQSTGDDCNNDFNSSNTQARDKALDAITVETADAEMVFDFSNQKASVEGVLDTDELLEMESDDNHLDNDNTIDSGSDVQSVPKATTYNDDWDTQETQIPDTVNEPAATAQNELTNSKKPLIIGIVFSSLLIAVIIAALIFTGVLSTSTNTAAPDNTSSTPNDNIETIETEVTTNSIPADDIESETSQAEVEPSAIDTPVASESQSSTANNAEATEVPLSEAASEPVSNEPQADTAISYEAFRQESQNTLYRDTND